MLKMKMMAFFKNPIVMGFLVVMLVIVVSTNFISVPTSEAESQIQVAFRASTMGVSVGKKDILMPEVAPNQNKQDSKEKKYDNVYCIDEGTILSYAEYQKEINLYNSEQSKKYFKNYNSALWVVDNMYISTATNSDISLNYLANLLTSPNVKKSITQYGNITSDNIKSLNKTVGNGSDKYKNVLNRNLIEILEQLVLWNYTNNKDTSLNIDQLVNAGLSGYNISNEDQNTCKYFYYAMKYLANNNSKYISNGTVENVISLDSSKATIDINKKQVGPYYLKAHGVALNIDNTIKSKISANITKLDGTVQTLGNDKIKVNEDGSFYINITDCGNITKSELKIGAVYSGAKATSVIIVNNKTQDLLNIKKTINTKEFKDSKEVSYSGKYTVKLIKTKADGSSAITNNPAIFTITGTENKPKEETNSQGILNITTDRPIELKNTDSYEIFEDQAPAGYQKYDGKIKLTVKFKLSGSNYVIDKENTNLEATGKNGVVNLNIPNDTTIEIYVPNLEEEKETPIFDLSLRKFISKIGDQVPEVSREPQIDEESKKILDEYKTAVYHHTKQSLTVEPGNKIEYTIRVYNEGEVDGYAKEIIDYLPEGLKFVKIADESEEYIATSENQKIVLKYTGNTAIKANSIDRILKNEVNNIYQEVKIICEVQEGATGYLTNRSEITNYGYNDNGTWKEAKSINNVDRDSVQNTISSSLNLDTWYKTAKKYTYTDNSGKITTISDYYPGTEDDDDFETVQIMTGSYKLVIKKVDSSNKNQGLEGAYFSVGENLITKVGPTDENGLVDVFKSQPITSSKDIKTVTIKETEAPYGYEGYDEEIKLQIATISSNGKYILDKQNTKIISKNEEGKVSLDVNESIITITISNDKKDFDLALRKFITNINEKQITNREPNVDITELKNSSSTTAKYSHSKDPIDVCSNDIVTYTLRVYNEGGLSGYATKIMDDVPDGLEFLPTHETNIKYNWKMYTESNETSADSITYNKKTYIPTEDVTKADIIITDYLKDELLQGFDSEKMNTLDYADVKVAFKVVQPITSDRIIINYAQITDDADFNKNKVVDRDSTPNEWINEEDDQDIEKIKLQHFDLSLRKWVTEVIITENGQTQVTKTGHKAEDNPEDIVKVDLKKSKLNDVKVQFRYSIRVTNESEIAGYAKEISDYIPNGLKFVAEDNPQWKEVDGKVVTNALADTLLEYQESAEVTILLTWENSTENMGTMINTAEISEDYNDYGAPDKDSTPNNKEPKEDDIDVAPVMLTVKTGSEVISYITLGLGVFAIIGLGVVGIKKYIA